jgi:hypothetical protein
MDKFHQDVQLMEDEMDRACSKIREKRNAYRMLVGRPGDRDHRE